MTDSGAAGGRSAPRVRVGVVVPAAGSGSRMGGASKPFLELAGEPILLHALRPFLADDRVVAICVALGAQDASQPPDWLMGLDRRIRVVEGGKTRGASVGRALDALPADVSVIAVHDAARPLVSLATVRACIDLAASGVGAVAGCPAVDTMKCVDGQGRVLSTADRSTLWHAHTPQVFPAETLRDAYAGGRDDATDDASLVEDAGGAVTMVDGGGNNLKVTRPGDVWLAEAILASGNAS